MAEPPSSPDPGISQPVDEPSTPNQVHDDPAPAAEPLRDDSILPKAEVATVKPEPIEWFEDILTSSSNKAKVIKSEMPDKDLGFMSEMPTQDTSIKPEIKEDPFDKSAADKSSPGSDIHGQLKPDPDVVSLPESASAAPRPSQSTMHQWANSPSPSQPVQTPFRITRSMTKAKSLTPIQRTVKPEYSLSGTGQAYSPFSILEPLETAQEDSGDEEAYSPTSDEVSNLSDVEFTFARPASTAAGSRRRRRPTLLADNELAEGSVAKSEIDPGNLNPAKAFREVIKIDDDSEDEDKPSKSQVESATRSSCSPVPAAFPSTNGKRKEAYQVPLFDFSSTGGKMWKFSVDHGAVRPFPESLMNMLQEWDRIHPDCRPPCTSTAFHKISFLTMSLSSRILQIFGKDGEEMEASCYKFTVTDKSRKGKLIYSPSFVCVLFSEKEQPRLWRLSPVKCGLNFAYLSDQHRDSVPVILTYLVAWLGVKKIWESPVCAVKVSTPKRLRYAQVFFDSCLDYKGSYDPLTLMEHRAVQRRRYNGNWISIKGAKRRKANSNTTANSSSRNAMLYPSRRHGHFKLLSCNQNISRVFPTAGCTVKTFFKEARDFYQNAEADGGMVLHLKMPGLLQER
jgi:hypothetical protein